jgi:arabinofuranosyltransferase
MILAGFGLVAAYLVRFIQDDAFISFRYAANLAHGDGLVFNPGERVEGYTNFLWTLLMAIPPFIGFEGVRFSQALGLLCFVGSLAMSQKLARMTTNRDADAPLVILLLATNYSFLCYATGGLETQLQTFLILTIACLGLVDNPLGRHRDALLLSGVCGVALLTRLDSIVVIAPILFVALARTIRNGQAGRPGRILALMAPAAIVMFTWFAWKLDYYGGVLPNTARVKGADAEAIWMGLRYVLTFVRSYWMAPVLLFTTLKLSMILRSVNGRVLVVSVGLWLAYVVVVGGDFMEFRFFVPVLPLAFVLVVLSLPQDTKLKAALVGTLIVGSLSHALTFRGVGAIESVRGLEAHVVGEEDNWRQVGVALGEQFHSARPAPSIATTAVGAIPYYSALPTVDMLGLTDPWVARHGIRVGERPGHRRLATTSYLVSRNVNLVLGHPQVSTGPGVDCPSYPPSSLTVFGLRDATRETIPPDARVIDLPLGEQRALRVLYLTRTPELDEIVTRVALRNCPVGTGPR